MIYVVYESSVTTTLGIWEKIQAQYRVFQQAFGGVFYTLYSGQNLYLFDENGIVEKELAFTKKECNEAIYKWTKKYSISRIYTRHVTTDRHDILFYKHMKQNGIKCVIEFPTIVRDYTKIDSRVIVSEDSYYRNRLHEYVCCCTTYSKMDMVYKIPCITLANGVEISKHPLKKNRKKDGTIVLLAVASLNKWHGYERVIEGMRIYYRNGGKRNLIFNVVGGGNQLEYYKTLVTNYHLEDHVFFRGELWGEKLDSMYDDSDIAVAPLGSYKIGVQSAAPIKSGEYCARGIPFVYGYDDVSFQDNTYFAYRVGNDPTPISMKAVIEFYSRIYEREDFIKDMREYAVSHLTWSTILQPVIEYLKK